MHNKLVIYLTKWLDHTSSSYDAHQETTAFKNLADNQSYQIKI